ncbi:MAG: GNAT family N-acetyltransferase [Nocardioidaceae bacterium]|nr:GNAT family N-acetyltransferase [Nocardioidaceae bacterium]
MLIRAMTAEDVAACERVSDEAFHTSDVALHRTGDPPPAPRTRQHSARWIARTLTMVLTDPDGCVVAEDGEEVVGVATGFRRDALWCLATYAVRPGLQGGGIGRALLDAALVHARPCARWMVSASADPRALHRYEEAGFGLLPQSMFFGAVDRDRVLPPVGLRPGRDEDHRWIDELDSAIRGGTHAPDRATLAVSGSLVVAEDRSGYVYAGPGTVALLAARDQSTAESLLRGALLDAEPGFELHHVSAVNGWARDLALRAGLAESPRGFLGVRGMAAPTSYVHHGALL